VQRVRYTVNLDGETIEVDKASYERVRARLG
jgi:flagellar biosynthesis/type III secretory pathway M-ring protein FliF/YscJ